MKPKVLILGGFGLNCDQETKLGFELCGAQVDVVHINDCVDGLYSFKQYQIMVFQGGFSFGDDTGSGNAYALKVRNHLWDELVQFIQRDTLVLGICNGFQILVNLGLLPALDNKYGTREVALVNNNNARYTVRFTDLITQNTTPWLRGIKTISLPIAHGEGKFFASKSTLDKLKKEKQIALVYSKGDICNYQNMSKNPNGTLGDIAGITDVTGRIFGLMPHPERALFPYQLPNWFYIKEKYERLGRKLPSVGPGLSIFRNGISYFSSLHKKNS